MKDWKTLLATEIERGRQAQIKGNLGLARVCARRAAGWAIRESLNREGVDIRTPSAYAYIQYLSEQEGNSAKLQETLSYLTKKVEKDSPEEDSYWPFPEIDLLKEAVWLIEELLDLSL